MFRRQALTLQRPLTLSQSGFYLSNVTSGNSAICWQEAALIWVSGIAGSTCSVMDAHRGMTQMKGIIPH